MPRSITVAIPRAIRSGFMRNGSGTWLFGNPSVETNPGFTEVTFTPYGSIS
jgi:hypothetical protein